MKKLLLSVLAMPLFLVACSDEKFDRNLNGTWQGEVQTSNIELLTSSNLDQRAMKETITYKFNDANLTTYRTQNFDLNSNKAEIEVGKYESSDNRIVYNIDAHSCVDAEESNNNIDKRPLSRGMSYSLSQDQNTLTISVGLGKKITLTRLSVDDAKLVDHEASMATPGCFTGGSSFKAGKVKKPTQGASVSEEQVSVDEQLDGIQEEVQSQIPDDQLAL